MEEGTYFGNSDGIEILKRQLQSGRIGSWSVDVEPVSRTDVKRFNSRPEINYHKTAVNKDRSDGHFAVAFVRIDLDDFITVQERILGLGSGDLFTENDAHFFKEHAENKLENMYPDELPLPYVELDKSGSLKNHQEGRHRAYLEKKNSHEYTYITVAIDMR